MRRAVHVNASLLERIVDPHRNHVGAQEDVGDDAVHERLLAFRRTAQPDLVLLLGLLDRSLRSKQLEQATAKNKDLSGELVDSKKALAEENK